MGEDIESQKKGAVVIVWFEACDINMEKWKSAIVNNIRNQKRVKAFQLTTVRASSVHICSPNTPAFRVGRSFLLMACDEQERARFKMHVGA